MYSRFYFRSVFVLCFQKKYFVFFLIAIFKQFNFFFSIKTIKYLKKTIYILKYILKAILCLKNPSVQTNLKSLRNNMLESRGKWITT